MYIYVGQDLYIYMWEYDYLYNIIIYSGDMYIYYIIYQPTVRSVYTIWNRDSWGFMMIYGDNT